MILFIEKPDNMTVTTEKFEMVIRHSTATCQIKT